MLSNRRGLTLVEMLVVVAIVGMLVGILMPALQAARESARQSSCRNNLRQLGIAINHYASSNSFYPYSVPYAGPTDAPAPADCNGTGWILRLLPFLDQASLYDRFNAGDCFSGSYNSGGLWKSGCREVMQVQTAILHCPSDSEARELSTTQPWMENIPVSRTSYKGVIGDTRIGGGWTGSADCRTTVKCPGIFWMHTFHGRISPAHVRDGLSNTFFVGEDVVGQNAHSAAYFSNGDYASCAAPPNFFNRPPRPRDWWMVMSFRSLHPGGVNFCLADGSVQFIDETIDLRTYQALATKAGRD
jgi:prepilin-type N-terminal cleavage/methylation domain-containing protein/prepilin-type processing-associated H-X9-DG protein